MKYTIGTDSIDTAKILMGLAAYLDDSDNYVLGEALHTFLFNLSADFDTFADKLVLDSWDDQIKTWGFIRERCNLLSRRIDEYFAEHSTE